MDTYREPQSDDEQCQYDNAISNLTALYDEGSVLGFKIHGFDVSTGELVYEATFHHTLREVRATAGSRVETSEDGKTIVAYAEPCPVIPQGPLGDYVHPRDLPMVQVKPRDPIDPTWTLQGHNGMIVKVDLRTGEMTFGENYDIGEAARVFWTTIGGMRPKEQK